MNNGYMPYFPGSMPAGLSNPADIQNRIQQLQNMQQQFQPAPQVPQQPNVNWIQVAGIEGARNQIVQPGSTAWMMDNNAPYFFVKSVDGMGTATLKAFRFEEVSPDALTAPQAAPVMAEAAESVIKKYSNGRYDHNVDKLYDAYLAAKQAYQTNGDQGHKDKLMEAVGRLMVEVYDMLSSMMMDSDFMDERKEIQRQIKKLAEM